VSTFAEKIRVMAMKSQAERAMSVALGPATVIRSYLDAGMEPPVEMIAEFLDLYGRAELLWLEFMVANQAEPESHD
jgi:hypothetical protein